MIGVLESLLRTASLRGNIPSLECLFFVGNCGFEMLPIGTVVEWGFLWSILNLTEPPKTPGPLRIPMYVKIMGRDVPFPLVVRRLPPGHGLQP